MNQITIGSFRYSGDIYQGRIQALGLDAPLCLAPVDPREGQDAPGLRVHLGDSADGFPVGEGRYRTDGSGRIYVAVRIDGPLFPRPIDAMLLSPRLGDVHYLVWERPSEPGKEG